MTFQFAFWDDSWDVLLGNCGWHVGSVAVLEKSSKWTLSWKFFYQSKFPESMMNIFMLYKYNINTYGCYCCYYCLVACWLT